MPGVDRDAEFITMNLPPRVSNADIMRWLDLLRNAGDDETCLLSGDDLDELSALGFRLLDDLCSARAELTELRGVVDWHEAIAHTAQLMLQRAWDDPVQLELRELLSDELANLAAAQEDADA